MCSEKSDGSDNNFDIFTRGTIIGAQITARLLGFYPRQYNGLPHLEQGGRRLSTNLKSRGSMVSLKQRLYRWNS
jgi:hypothetical protein